MSFRSKQVGWSAAANRAPLSRGAACAIAGVAGPVDAGSPCPFANGRFDDALPVQPTCAADAGNCSSNHWVQLDLGSLQPLGAVFAHGLSATGKVGLATSVDGVAFIEVARADEAGAYFTFSLPPGTTARYVRLTAEERIYALNELSAW